MTPTQREGRLRLGRLFIVAFVTGLSGAMMPGTLLAATIGQTMVQGFRAVIGLITGHALLELVVVALLAAGMQKALRDPKVRGAIGLLGGAALIWMGWDMIRSASGLSIEVQSAQEAYSWAKLLLWGAGVCIANPYFTGWWATIGAGQMAHMAPQTVSEYVSFYLGHEASDYAWYSIVGLLIVTGRGWLLQNVAVYHGLVYGCGVIVAALGAWFLYTGARFVLGRQRDAEDDGGENGSEENGLPQVAVRDDAGDTGGSDR